MFDLDLGLISTKCLCNRALEALIGPYVMLSHAIWVLFWGILIQKGIKRKVNQNLEGGTPAAPHLDPPLIMTADQTFCINIKRIWTWLKTIIPIDRYNHVNTKEEKEEDWKKRKEIWEEERREGRSGEEEEEEENEEKGRRTKQRSNK